MTEIRHWQTPPGLSPGINRGAGVVMPGHSGAPETCRRCEALRLDEVRAPLRARAASMTNRELVVVAVFLACAESPRPDGCAHLEEIAMLAFSLRPSAFSMKRYPDVIDTNAIYAKVMGQTTRRGREQHAWPIELASTRLYRLTPAGRRVVDVLARRSPQ